MTKQVFRASFWFLIISVIFVLISPSKSQATYNQARQRNLLLLHSYHKGLTWVDDITDSVTSTLLKSDPGMEIHVEYMDTKRVIGEEHLGNLYEEYRHKFKQVKFDIVLVSDDTALRFVLKHYDELFPGVPVVFCGINNLEPRMLDNRPGFTGVLEQVDVAETVNIALTLQPETKHVYIINDMSASGKGLHKEIAKAIIPFATRVDFTFLEDYTADELAAIIAKLPAKSIILRSAFFLDKSGTPLQNEKISFAAVGNGANVPVYSLWDFYMGLGIVGGKMISGTAQGDFAASIAIRILGGEKPSNIPIIQKSPNRLMFDYRQLKRFGIDCSVLPPDSIVINEPKPFYAINKTIVRAAIIFALIMTSITILLILNIKRRRKAEASLIELRDTLQEKNEELQMNEESLREQNDELMSTEEMLRVQIEEFENSQKLLKDSEERFKALHDASFGGIIIHDKWHILDCNQMVFDISGFTSEELIGKDGLILIAPESLERLKQQNESRFDQRYEVVGLRKDGTRYPLVLREKTIPYKGGVAQVTEFRDATRRKQLEKEMLKAEKLQSLGVLAGGIAHDFNNILTGIMGNISFAQMFVDETHKSHKPMVEAERASIRAAQLAHQLLTFARGGEPVKKLVSVKSVLDETLSLVLHGSNVSGVMDIPDSLHAIEADEGQISQVFQNIVINATQAMPGGGTLTITAENEKLGEGNVLSLPPGNYVRLTFSDQGCGIPEDNLKKIFDPYFTTKLGGNGLGLASVHSIISRHSGHIGVSSTVGKGTTMTVHLPSIGETDFKKHTLPMVHRIEGHQGGSILIMDDEEMIRDMATEMLEYLGYQITTCTSGEEAIKHYEEAMKSASPFAAVILDLTIPGGLGGKEAAEKIIAIDPGACLIVSSGYSNDPIMSEYEMYGFSGAVAKPYKIKELGEMLASVLS